MSFKYDYEYLIHLLICALKDEQPEEKPENISFEKVFTLGKLHEVGNIAFLSVDRLENKPVKDLYNEWQVFYFHSVQRDARQSEERAKILSLLHENKIRTLEAQGTVTKKYYPYPELRMMSDIDIIVDKENLPKINELVQSLGYETELTDKEEVNAFNHNGMEIEFHYDFFTEHMYTPKEKYYNAVNSPFEHAKPKNDNAFEYILDETYFYLYSLLHTIKHFEHSGCGIRRIMDIYILNNALKDKIDFDFINSVIVKYGFRDSADKLFALEKFWFENIEPSVDLTDTIKDIISGGNHGTDDLKLKNELKQDKESLGIDNPKRQRIKDIIFPEKEGIYEAYPICRERGYSQLMCWIYRWAVQLKRHNLREGLNRIKRIIKIK